MQEELKRAPLPLPQPMRVEFERPHGLVEMFYYTAEQMRSHGKAERLEGRRDMHETNIELVNQICDLSEKLERRTPVSGEVAEGVEVDRNAASPAAPAGQRDAGRASFAQGIWQPDECATCGLPIWPANAIRAYGDNRQYCQCVKVQSPKVSGHAGAAKGGSTKLDLTDYATPIYTANSTAGTQISAQGIDHAKLAEGDIESCFKRDCLAGMSDPSDWDENATLCMQFARKFYGQGWQARGQQAGVPEAPPLYSTRLAAARYRFIRENSYVEVVCNSPRAEGWSPAVLDAAIDRAIAAAAAPGEA